MKRILTLLAIAIACLASCTEDLAKEYSISLESTRLSFDSEGGKQQVSLESTYGWEVYGGDYWCRVSPRSGEGDAEVVFTIDPNMAEDGRSAKFVFTSGNKETTLTVTQEKKEYSISIEPKELKFGSEGGEQEITVTSSGEWEVKGGSYWCNISVTSGNNGDKVTFTADPYENTTEERSATFTFYCGDKYVDLIVTQEAKVYSISVEPKELTFEAEGGEKQITIMSSDNWSRSSLHSWSNWITLSEYSGENGAVVTVTLKYNTQDARSGDIIFICGDKEAKVVVTQQADDSPIIQFTDHRFLEALLSYYNGSEQPPVDRNADRQISEKEASVTSIIRVCNDIRNIDEIRHFTSLTYLDCSYNQLTSLDVSNNTALTYLDCCYNQLTSLDVSNNTALTYLDCRNNQLTSLDLSNNTALTELWCNSNKLTSLDLSNNTALTYLDCCYNQLTSLDVSNNTALTYLNCRNNQLTSLDVSNNTALTYLGCSYNQLTSLDVSNNTALTYLDCRNNQLTSLDLSNQRALTKLDCLGNPLEEIILYKYHMLPDSTIDGIKREYGDIITYTE